MQKVAAAVSTPKVPSPTTETKKVDKVAAEGVSPKLQKKSTFSWKHALSHTLIVLLSLSASLYLRHGEYASGLRSILADTYDHTLKQYFQDGSARQAIQELKNLRKETLDLQKQIFLELLDNKENKDVDADTNSEDRFYMHQFKDFFRITPIDKIEIHSSIADKLKDYKLSEDEYYLENKSECDRLDGEYRDYLSRPHMYDDRFMVKWSDKHEKYALFARINIPTRSVLGYFTGELRQRMNNIDDSWKWKGTVMGDDGFPLNLVIDGRFKGNWFHFLRLGRDGNVDAMLVPDIQNNMWNVMFKNKRPIEAGEELFINLEDLE